ncbi:cupin domain-containing protein, partial [Enterococcus faecium]
MMTKHEVIHNGVIFPAGEKKEAYAQVFHGQIKLNKLVNDPEVSVCV